jgi:hypothetical protein
MTSKSEANFVNPYFLVCKMTFHWEPLVTFAEHNLIVMLYAQKQDLVAVTFLFTLKS